MGYSRNPVPSEKNGPWYVSSPERRAEEAQRVRRKSAGSPRNARNRRRATNGSAGLMERCGIPALECEASCRVANPEDGFPVAGAAREEQALVVKIRAPRNKTRGAAAPAKRSPWPQRTC